VNVCVSNDDNHAWVDHEGLHVAVELDQLEAICVSRLNPEDITKWANREAFLISEVWVCMNVV
jgi:hypothetical protein